MPSTAIKISEALANDARAAAADADRSLTGQIEHWARIGKAFEPNFSARLIAILKKSGGDLSAIEDEREREEVLEALASLRLEPPFLSTTEELSRTTGPKFEVDPRNPDGIVQIQADGTRVAGRFVNRAFVPTTAD